MEWAESRCQSSAVTRISASQTVNGWMRLLTSILPRRKHDKNTIIGCRRSELQTTGVGASSHTQNVYFYEKENIKKKIAKMLVGCDKGLCVCLKVSTFNVSLILEKWNSIEKTKPCTQTN